MDAGLVDRAFVFLGPIIVGGPAPGPVAGAGVTALAQAWRLRRMQVRRCDQDIVIEGYVELPARAEVAPLRGGGQGAPCSPAS
jgi:riboflavin biosynthesis pyrimidine reductase